MVHEQKRRSGKMIADAITTYLKKLDEIRIRRLTIFRPKVGWKPPLGSTVKTNFDSSFDRYTFRSCSGVMVRDISGVVLVSRSIIHQNVASPFMAEAIACFWVIRTCKEGNWSDVEIEGDALSIIKKCKSNNEDRSEIRALIKNINSYVRNFQKIQFQHVPREANYLAHILAMESLKKEEEVYLEAGVPDFVKEIYEKEIPKAPD